MKAPVITILIDGKPLNEWPQHSGYSLILHNRDGGVDAHADMNERELMATLGVTLSAFKRLLEGIKDGRKPRFPIRELYEELYPRFVAILASQGLMMLEPNHSETTVFKESEKKGTN